MDILRGYPWPGNVRELQNVIERAVILSAGPAITAQAITVAGHAAPPSTEIAAGHAILPLAEAECQAITAALPSFSTCHRPRCTPR